MHPVVPQLKNVDTHLICIVIYHRNFLFACACFSFLQVFRFQTFQWIYLRFIATKLSVAGHSNAKSRKRKNYHFGAFLNKVLAQYSSFCSYFYGIVYVVTKMNTFFDITLNRIFQSVLDSNFSFPFYNI